MTYYKAHWAIASKLLYVTQVCALLLQFEGQAPEPLQPLSNSSPAASVNQLWDCQNQISTGTLQRRPDQLPNLSHHTVPQAATLMQGWRQKCVVEGGGKSKTDLLWNCNLSFSFSWMQISTIFASYCIVKYSYSQIDFFHASTRSQNPYSPYTLPLPKIPINITDIPTKLTDATKTRCNLAHKL